MYKRFVILPPIPILTSDDGDAGKGNGEGGDKARDNDNNHHSNIDMGSNTGSHRVGGNNMVQDRVASQTVNNTFPPAEGGIG
jgi:hypothetical protein